jgi:hypothetical protein
MKKTAGPTDFNDNPSIDDLISFYEEHLPEWKKLCFESFDKFMIARNFFNLFPYYCEEMLEILRECFSIKILESYTVLVPEMINPKLLAVDFCNHAGAGKGVDTIIQLHLRAVYIAAFADFWREGYHKLINKEYYGGIAFDNEMGRKPDKLPEIFENIKNPKEGKSQGIPDKTKVIKHLSSNDEFAIPDDLKIYNAFKKKRINHTKKYKSLQKYLSASILPDEVCSVLLNKSDQSPIKMLLSDIASGGFQFLPRFFNDKYYEAIKNLKDKLWRCRHNKKEWEKIEEQAKEDYENDSNIRCRYKTVEKYIISLRRKGNPKPVYYEYSGSGGILTENEEGDEVPTKDTPEVWDSVLVEFAFWDSLKPDDRASLRDSAEGKSNTPVKKGRRFKKRMYRNVDPSLEHL